jgi:hypothetical protein
VELEQLHREIADLDHVLGVNRRRVPGTDPGAVDEHRVDRRHHGEHVAFALQVDDRVHAGDMLLRVIQAHGAFRAAPDRHARGVDRAPLRRREPSVRARFDVDDVRHSSPRGQAAAPLERG